MTDKFPEYLYRFRSAKSFFEFEELEKQEIYFAKFSELNDPMEGFKDVYWKGDKIVWRNLFKDYVISLAETYGLTVITPDGMFSEPVIVLCRDYFHMQRMAGKYVFKDLTQEFFSNKIIDRYIEHLSKRENPVKRKELVFYLKSIHLYALRVCRKILVKHKMLPKDYYKQNEETEKHLGLLSEDLFDKIEEDIGEAKMEEAAVIAMYAHDQAALSMINEVNPENKLKFILFWFTEKFVNELETLMYPDFYSASFVRGYDNSSMWGHYAEGHKGICLKFKSERGSLPLYLPTSVSINQGKTTENYNFVPNRFHKINYDSKLEEVGFFRNLGSLPKPVIDYCWHLDDEGNKSECYLVDDNKPDGWRKDYWDKIHKCLNTKTLDWNYENEYRLLLTSSLFDYSEKEKRKVKYKFSDLAGIIFGMRTSEENKLKIINLVKKKNAEERKNFKFYQAYHDHANHKIEVRELSFLDVFDFK